MQINTLPPPITNISIQWCIKHMVFHFRKKRHNLWARMVAGCRKLTTGDLSHMKLNFLSLREARLCDRVLLVGNNRCPTYSVDTSTHLYILCINPYHLDLSNHTTDHVNMTQLNCGNSRGPTFDRSTRYRTKLFAVTKSGIPRDPTVNIVLMVKLKLFIIVWLHLQKCTMIRETEITESNDCRRRGVEATTNHENLVLVQEKEFRAGLGKHEKIRIIKNVAVLGIAFMIHFTAFHGTANLQSSVNPEKSLGTFTLAAVYGSLILSNIFLPVIVIRWVKWKQPPK